MTESIALLPSQPNGGGDVASNNWTPLAPGVHDYVTVIKSPIRANKLYKLTKDGITKEAPKYASKRIAKTHYVPNLKAMRNLLTTVGNDSNAIIVHGYVPDIGYGEEFSVVSKSDLQKLTGNEDVTGIQIVDGKKYIARLKATFHSSSWFMFDCDMVKGMPDHLVFETPDSWWAKMKEWLPMLSEVGYLWTQSNSARILNDGVPYAKSNGHFYLQCKNPSDLERAGSAMLVHSFDHKAGFMRPIYNKKDGKLIGQRPWSMFDPTTFTTGREDYCGAPEAEQSLVVTPAAVILHEGGRVDTEQLKNPSRTQEKITGLTMTKNGHLINFNVSTLSAIRYNAPIKGFPDYPHASATL